MTEARIYGVSSGNGNDGVSHAFADYYVHTNEPWRLAELALLTSMKPEFHRWVRNEMWIDGEAEYTISAVLHNPPDETYENDTSWCDANGAWFIIEVFPDDEPREGVMVYNSIDDAFGDDAKLVPGKHDDNRYTTEGGNRDERLRTTD